MLNEMKNSVNWGYHVGREGEKIVEELYMEIEISNLLEFKKLVKQAESQLNQLNETLNKIETFEFRTQAV